MLCYREQNSRLVPLKLQELHKLQMRAAEERHQAALASRPFAHLGHNNREIVDMEGKNGITVASRAKKRVPSHHKENGNGRLYWIYIFDEGNSGRVKDEYFYCVSK